MKLRMFLLFFSRSISERKGRIAIASISVTLAVTVIIGMIAVSIGVGDKLGNELKTYGANIIPAGHRKRGPDFNWRYNNPGQKGIKNTTGSSVKRS